MRPMITTATAALPRALARACMLIFLRDRGGTLSRYEWGLTFSCQSTPACKSYLYADLDRPSFPFRYTEGPRAPGWTPPPGAGCRVAEVEDCSSPRHRPRQAHRGWVDSDGMICRAESARSHRRERLSACHMRATRQGAQRIATVTHGQVDADNQDRCSCRSADKSGDRTSKLVMRVRFPSSAPCDVVRHRGHREPA
jgi:hypothetical protein